MESEGDTSHFARLLTNSDPNQMRGYDDDRWRDRGLLLLNAEYRFPVWAYRERRGTGIDGYLFVDSGQVFSDDDRPALRDLVHSYGGGFRLSMDQIFQYPKNALYHGRPPIPLR